MPAAASPPARTLVLFNHDFDRVAFDRLASRWPHESWGFDLFSFPSNAQLAWFNIERTVERLARQATQRGWQAVVSNQEQFGALTAALLAERMGWPGTPVAAVLACQHKLHARRVLQRVCPEANVAFEELPVAYGEPIPEGLRYPAFVKPVKAAFSVLARTVQNRDELQAHTRFGPWEGWVIRHLVEPFERVVRQRLPEAGSAHRVMLEAPVHAPQYNLDGYVHQGHVRLLGVVDAVMVPGTQAFMRFDYPSRLKPAAVQQAMSVAQRFLQAVGFDHGLFNMEFFFDPHTEKLTVIEFNPRMAAQFSDLYEKVDGVNLHELALAQAHGLDPATVPRHVPTAGVASSFVFRHFEAGAAPSAPRDEQRRGFAARHPDGVLLHFPRSASTEARDLKWLGSVRHGVMHLSGRDAEDLRHRCEAECAALGWALPYADAWELAPGPSGTLPRPRALFTAGTLHPSAPLSAQSSPYAAELPRLHATPNPHP